MVRRRCLLAVAVVREYASHHSRTRNEQVESGSDTGASSTSERAVKTKKKGERVVLRDTTSSSSSFGKD